MMIKRWRGEEEEAGSKERTGCMVIEKQKENLAVSLVSSLETTKPRRLLDTHAVKTDQPAHARLVDLASDLGERRSGRVGRTVRTGRGDLSVDPGQEGGEGGEGGKGRHEHLERVVFAFCL